MTQELVDEFIKLKAENDRLRSKVHALEQAIEEALKLYLDAIPGWKQEALLVIDLKKALEEAKPEGKA